MFLSMEEHKANYILVKCGLYLIGKGIMMILCMVFHRNHYKYHQRNSDYKTECEKDGVLLQRNGLLWMQLHGWRYVRCLCRGKS